MLKTNVHGSLEGRPDSLLDEDGESKQNNLKQKEVEEQGVSQGEPDIQAIGALGSENMDDNDDGSGAIQKNEEDWKVLLRGMILGYVVMVLGGLIQVLFWQLIYSFITNPNQPTLWEGLVAGTVCLVFEVIFLTAFKAMFC